MELLGYQIEQKLTKTFADNVALAELLDQLDGKKRASMQELFRLRDREKLSYFVYDDGREVGKFEFSGIYTPTPEIGVEISEEYRGRGIAYVLLRELIKSVCKEHSVEYFIYRVRGDNEPSIRLVKKLGGALQRELSVEGGFALSTYHVFPAFSDNDDN